jgi:hypothetical protein
MHARYRKDRDDNRQLLSFRLTTDDTQKIAEYADRHDASISWAVRQLVRAGLEKAA